MPEVLNSVLGVHYVFPSKELLLRAVHEDVVFERSRILQDAAGFAADLGSGMIEGARTACTKLIEPDPGQPLRQYELTVWALRAAGMAELARWQYERCIELLTAYWEQLAARAEVTLAVPTGVLARLQLAGADGCCWYLATRDLDRTVADRDAHIRHLVRYADPQPAG
ncbi:hypothetical protein ACWGDS_22280 [Streptomyces sp. NPDC055059]|jgi:AcrR family transcriptional regulator|uniref:TetR family transcriptional regulator n=1 Tax=Streptomyces sp. NBC_00119 TaxID=2975659 RepID=A0AAU1UKY9_9ACTN|nr:hypothetical protein [Streptomyces sp. NBC_01446]MCX4649762.1 hypothetical protein [Streptomyces sp. NBC_01446]